MTEPADRAVATALQRVLLPPGLPEIDGWAVATLYEPAGNDVLVGGDFYDWFVLPNGHVLFFIGDVSGKGPVAGALGMSIRKALKGIAWVCGDPFAALGPLEHALADEFREAFATLCLLELIPAAGQVRLLLAGHPVPWLRRGGSFAEVPAPENGLLGPQLQGEWKSMSLQLEPGDLLVIFSDGLTEARMPDGRLFGEGPLQEFLSSHAPAQSSYATVLQVYQHLAKVTTELSDDVIIGVLRYQPNEA
jgi:sigma-B regulation protein RsbU (phosphoserine phosphatase)